VRSGHVSNPLKVARDRSFASEGGSHPPHPRAVLEPRVNFLWRRREDFSIHLRRDETGGPRTSGGRRYCRRLARHPGPGRGTEILRLAIGRRSQIGVFRIEPQRHDDHKSEDNRHVHTNARGHAREIGGSGVNSKMSATMTGSVNIPPRKRRLRRKSLLSRRRLSSTPINQKPASAIRSEPFEGCTSYLID
jgi:hypothetical protein